MVTWNDFAIAVLRKDLLVWRNEIAIFSVDNGCIRFVFIYYIFEMTFVVSRPTGQRGTQT